MKKQRSPLGTKKKMVPKKPSTLKPKAKQVVSDNHRKSGSYKRKRTRIDDLYDNIEAKVSVMERAEEVLESLAAEFPSFIKCMLPSNVAHGFWLILPKKFCNLHLPRHDTRVILVDECGEEYKTNYLLERHGLSGGWRGFSIAHRLLKGDRLVFHLVGPCKLKVQIVRVYGLDEVDAALCLMNLDACGKTTDSDQTKKDNTTHKKAKKYVHLPQKDQKNGQRVSNSDVWLTPDEFEDNSDGFSTEVLRDSETTNRLQSNKLSCSGSSFLHDHSHKDINCRLAGGRIS